MTAQEFSNEFDILYNNIMSNQAPGLDEYEKSVFLTKAQYEILKNYFNPKGNKYQEGFDGNPKRQIDFSNLMTTKSISLSTTAKFANSNQGAVSITMPEGIFIIVNETVEVTPTKTLQVVPIRFDEYLRLCSKPYKQPLKFQAWRLITDKTLSADLVLGHNNSFSKYIVRYIKKPKPIILENLGDLTIEGQKGEEVSSSSEVCELDSELHPEILQRAVELAKSAYIGDINSNIELGKRSE